MTDDDLLLELVNKLKEENADLKGKISDLKLELDAKRKPLIDFSKVRIPWEALATLVFVLMAMAALGTFVYCMAVSEATGKYYPKYVPWGRSKHCWIVKKEITFGQDRTIGKCAKDKEEAYRSAEDNMRLWQENRAKDKEFREQTEKIMRGDNE